MSEPVRIAIGSADRDSVVWIGSGLLRGAGSLLVSPSGRYLLVSSAGPRAAAERVRAALSGRLLLDLEIDDREEAKTLRTVERILDASLEAGLRRDDAFVAVGGGVVSDAVGFAAAVALRGVAWNVVPTTTGAMADAAIGGKTGVDHPQGKNLIGAFHLPRVVLIDPAAAATLPDREYRAGLIEAFKGAWIADAALARRSARSLDRLLGREEAALLDLIGGSALVKASIVASDPKEAGRRRILNFGHTLGHAFEAAGDFRALRHGEAVAWGIVAALELSRRRAGLPEPEAQEVRRALARLGPFPDPERDPGRLRSFLVRDKKATARGIGGVLLERIGHAYVEEAIPVEEWLDAAAGSTLS